MAEISSVSRLRDVLNKHSFRCRKRWGQNFLVDGNIVRRIVRAANLSPDDIVVEIGPGAGTLTHLLAENVKLVVAIEVDQRLSPVLKENLDGLTNVEIVFEDAMKVDFDHLVRTKSKEISDPHILSYKVVANLPYSITTPVLMYLLRRKFHFKSLFVMVQREVAKRLTAVPGSKDYGALSVAVRYYTVPEILFYVPRSVFFPRPEVDSAVVYLARREIPAGQIPAEDLFFSLVRGAFGQRRKTILNALAGSREVPGFSRRTWEEILQAGSIDPSRRGESLSLEEFAVLCWRCWEQLS